jgi:hypothetical protein
MDYVRTKVWRLRKVAKYVLSKESCFCSRCFVKIMAHALYICTYCYEFLLVQLRSLSSNTAGITFLLYQCVQRFTHLSLLPSQDRKFRDDITKRAFRSYPNWRSSIITQAISFLLRFSLWNRPRKILCDRKGLVNFWVTGKD